MWKAFTSAAPALALALALAGCAGGPPATVLPDPGSVTADPAATPAPIEVRARNADAFAAGTAALRNDDLGTAERLLSGVTADQPELAGPWLNLAQVYIAQGRTDDARRALERAVDANPANCDARSELALLLRRQGDFAAAEQHYRSCLAARPDYPAAHLNLGILYELYLGRLPEALEAYRRYQALTAEPDRNVAGWVQDIERRLGV